MHFSKSFLRTAFFTAAIVFSLLVQARADKSTLTTPSQTNDLFDVSLGYNYLHLGDASPETGHLHGFDISAFYNWTSWLGLGVDFMGDFGNNTVPISRHLNVDLDSRRYIYVFGPRFNVWQNSQFRLFFEALAGGAHAEASVSVENRGFEYSRTASGSGFGAAVGAGLDWRFARHFSWRVQADYVPTEFSGDWQHDFRASSGIVYSFGGH